MIEPTASDRVTSVRRRVRWQVFAAGAGSAVFCAAAAVAWLNSPVTGATAWKPTPVLASWSHMPGGLDALSKPARFQCDGIGPEAIAVDSKTGEVATGFSDGHIRLVAGVSAPRTIGSTYGVPLGVGFLGDASIVVADAKRGLVRVDRKGRVSVLSRMSDGVPIRYADGLVVDGTGRYAYFTDVSTRRKLGEDVLELVEHRGTGRLLRFDTKTRQTTTLMSGLQFANGVALGPNDEFIVVAEMGAYRIQQYWLKGPLSGKSRVFADGLPGIPDNITFNGRDRFWVGLHNPRLDILDRLAGYPTLRRLLYAPISRALDSSDPGSRAVGLSLAGIPVAYLRGRGPHAYGPVTEVHQVRNTLLIGSDTAPCLAAIPVPAAR